MHCMVCKDISNARLPVGALDRDRRSNTALEDNSIRTWRLQTAVRFRKCSLRQRGQVSSRLQSSIARETQVPKIWQKTADVLSIILQSLPNTRLHVLARKLLLWPACIRAVYSPTCAHGQSFHIL